MAVAPISLVQRWTGLSTDSKPTTGVPVGSLFFEVDTGITYIYSSTAWSIISSGAYWDRAGVTRLLVYDADGVAPHVQTIRATRTVPSGSIARVEAGFVRLCRATVATTPGTSARGFCRMVRSSVSYPYAGLDLDASTAGNVAGFAKSIATPGCGILIAADQLDLTTRDDNTGGTVNYASMAKMTEFIGGTT